jgi:YidC/Oxa1 family membrane protein insertase
MNQETRFVLAVVLMLAVLIGTNYLFAPAPSEEALEEAPTADEVVESEDLTRVEETAEVSDTVVEVVDPDLPILDPQQAVPTLEVGVTGEVTPSTLPERFVEVRGPLYDVRFTTRGARAIGFQLPEFPSFARTGPVELVGDPDTGMFGSRLIVSGDTVDLRHASFRVEPEDGLQLETGGGPATLSFIYEHPDQPFTFEVAYRFDPDAYLIEVSGRVRGLERGLLLTDLGRGLAFNEAQPDHEAREMAYVSNHFQNGIRTRRLADVDRGVLEEGPFHWAALKSRYFVVGMLPSIEPGGTELFGGVLAVPVDPENEVAHIAVTQSLGSGGLFSYQIFAGPQDYQLLSSIGRGFQEVNPVGWRFIRPILRPFVGVIMWVLVTLHEALGIGYGWVLILFGVMMRVVLFPLYHKSMKAQLRNMAVQPLLKDIQTKYKDQPEKMQKELMRLYKEHGFNPLAGCWPMLLPWPILIALFFVFQNTIELRGVPFAWLPDLSAADPFFILPVLLGISMFLMQWISLRTLEEVNPQMKMMMWFLPIFMVILFANFPSGLNLYYLTANLATLPQSWWIANERQKVQAKGPPVVSEA